MATNRVCYLVTTIILVLTSTRCAVTASIYETNDAIIIEAGNVGGDTNIYQSYLMSNSFMKEKERSCFTRDGTFGSCTTLRSCYPNIKLPQLRHLGLWSTAIRGTCNYIAQDETLVYGVCCSKQMVNDNYDEAGDHLLHEPFSTLTANQHIGLAYHPAPHFPWLLNDPNGQANIKKTTEWIKTFVDSKPSTNCGAGPTKLLTFDEQRVVGGTDAVRHSWPGMAGLRYNGYFFCGASLIGPSKILTAAHCVDWITAANMNKLTVDLGMHDKDQGDAQVTKNVIRIVIHKGWNPVTFANDIAMLTLDSPVTFTSTISPFCLPSPGLADRYIDSEAAIIGWGNIQEDGPGTSVLQQATVKVTSNFKCKKVYPLLIYSMLCASAPGKDTCQGDSGGPLLIRSSTDSRWMVAGIVSYGIGCARPGIPGVYTRITSFRPWIRFHLVF